MNILELENDSFRADFNRLRDEVTHLEEELRYAEQRIAKLKDYADKIDMLIYDMRGA